MKKTDFELNDMDTDYLIRNKVFCNCSHKSLIEVKF
jgi:hypothetical protein